MMRILLPSEGQRLFFDPACACARRRVTCSCSGERTPLLPSHSSQRVATPSVDVLPAKHNARDIGAVRNGAVSCHVRNVPSSSSCAGTVMHAPYSSEAHERCRVARVYYVLGTSWKCQGGLRPTARN